MRRLVIDLADDRPIFSLPDHVVASIRATLPPGWEAVVVRAPAKGTGDGAGAASPAALEAVRGAEVYLGFGVPAELLRAGSALRWVHSGSAGVAMALTAEMLERDIVFTNSAGIHGPPVAETVLARIEELRLDRRFECVLLASHLVNVHGDRERQAFLRTCAGHARGDGQVLIQRYDPAWAANPGPSERTVDGVTVRVVEARRDGPLLHGTVEYEAEARRWRHGPFTSRILEDEELLAELAHAGLALDRWLDEAHSWFAARPRRSARLAPRRG
jgi:hypothetical protein